MMNYEDVVLAFAIFGLITGLLLTAFGVWQIKKQKQKSLS